MPPATATFLPYTCATTVRCLHLPFLAVWFLPAFHAVYARTVYCAQLNGQHALCYLHVACGSFGSLHTYVYTFSLLLLSWGFHSYHSSRSLSTYLLFPSYHFQFPLLPFLCSCFCSVLFLLPPTISFYYVYSILLVTVIGVLPGLRVPFYRSATTTTYTPHYLLFHLCSFWSFSLLSPTQTPPTTYYTYLPHIPTTSHLPSNMHFLLHTILPTPTLSPTTPPATYYFFPHSYSPILPLPPTFQVGFPTSPIHTVPQGHLQAFCLWRGGTCVALLCLSSQWEEGGMGKSRILCYICLCSPITLSGTLHMHFAFCMPFLHIWSLFTFPCHLFTFAMPFLPFLPFVFAFVPAHLR